MTVDTTKLRDLLAKATPGPWHVDNSETRKELDHKVQIRPSDPFHIAIAYTWTPLDYNSEKINARRVMLAENNADLIIETRNTLPSLLDEVEALRSDVERLRGYNAELQSLDGLQQARIEQLEARLKESLQVLQDISHGHAMPAMTAIVLSRPENKQLLEGE